MSSHRKINQTDLCLFEVEESSKWGQSTTCTDSGANNLEDSHSTINSQLRVQSEKKIKSKFYGFQRLKQSKIREKNQVGATLVRQILYPNFLAAKTLNLRPKTLDDAVSCVSCISPKSSTYVEKCQIEESIIVMRGNNVMQMSDLQPQTPYFRNCCSQKILKKKESEYLIPFRQCKPLLLCGQSGILCHYQIIRDQINKEIMSLLQSMNSTGILTPFGSFSKSLGPNLYQLILYQPYTESLSEFISRQKEIQLKKVIEIFIQITKILCYLRDQCIYPILSVQNSFFFVDDLLKFKVLPVSQENNAGNSQKEMTKRCGKFFIDLLKNFQDGYFWQNRKFLRKVKGLIIDRKMALVDLFNEFIFNQEFSLEEGYLRLQTFQY